MPFCACWRRKNRNLYVVGDEDQSIYRWRGADYRNILRFQQDFKDAKTILLEQNYRSTQNILDGAMAVIDHNRNRTAKKLFTDAKRGEKSISSSPRMTAKRRIWSSAPFITPSRTRS